MEEIIHDIETYPNFFCVVFMWRGKFKVIEISSRKDDSEELRNTLIQWRNKYYLTGFNNVKFDGQLLQMFLDNYNLIKEEPRGSKKAEILYTYAQDIIDAQRGGGFPPYPEFQLENKHIDLFLINHYNNLSKSTSLKWLEFAMRWDKVQDLPYHHTDVLTVDKFDPIIEYCKNDVYATGKFREHCNEIVELRHSQVIQYNNDYLLNKSDSSVGEYIFLSKMSDYLGVSTKSLRGKRTYRKRIKVGELILPYINFKTEAFKGILEEFKKVILTEDNDTFKASVNYQGIDYDFGIGGLHASYNNRIFESDEEYVIEDQDVASFYPNLAIVNNFYPEHLSKDFCVVYKSIYEQRKKIPKDNPNNKSLKLSLNSVYGKSNDKYSFLYDPKFTFSITVNGQLSLLMLAERLSLIESCTIIQCNTDGLTYKIKRTDLEEAHKICKKFENLTKLDLEAAIYDKMVIRDVNNYLAIYDNGKVKYKGCFEIDCEWHKNHSQRIVPLALSRYYVNGIPIEDTLSNHLKTEGYDWNEEKGKWGIQSYGIYDFCLGKKSNGKVESYKTVGKNAEEIKDKVIRFYASKKGSSLFKVYKSDNVKFIPDQISLFDGDLAMSQNKVESVLKGYKVKFFMDYSYEKDYQVDVDYYINECGKITNIIK